MASVEIPLHKILKTHREQKRFSLHSIHQETRIPVIYLDAMEAGNWKTFPAEVYLIGFLQKYAKYLGLDPEEMVQLYRNEQEAQNSVKQEEVKKVEQVVYREKNDAFVKGLVFAILILVVAVWWIYTIVGSSSARKKEPVHEAVASAAVSPAINAGTSGGASKLFLDVHAKGSVWVRIVSDQALQFEGFLTPGTTRQYAASKDFLVRIGNVNALELALNGRKINPSIGSVQDVGEMRLTPESLSNEIIFMKGSEAPKAPATESKNQLDSLRNDAKALLDIKALSEPIVRAPHQREEN